LRNPADILGEGQRVQVSQSLFINEQHKQSEAVAEFTSAFGTLSASSSFSSCKYYIHSNCTLLDDKAFAHTSIVCANFNIIPMVMLTKGQYKLT